MLNYYTPLVAVIIALIIFIWIACIVMSLQREGLDFSDLDKWEDTPVILPTDSLVGPRVTDQKEVLQVANGGDQRIWIEWRATPVYYSYPFYPDDYIGEQEIVKTKGGGRLRIDPGQYIFFPSKKEQIEGVRLWSLMGCTDEIAECKVGTNSVTPYFEFLFSPPGSDATDGVAILVETGITLPFNLSYFSGDENAVTSMTCSLPPSECSDELRAENANGKFVGCSATDKDAYADLLAQNCIITQSPTHKLVGSEMFERNDIQHFHFPSFTNNRFKLTFYVTGFEWIK